MRARQARDGQRLDQHITRWRSALNRAGEMAGD